MDFKSLSDSLDKLTDILNVGRLIFYTAAGFCVALPVAMTLRLLAHVRPAPYWTQLVADAAAGARHPGVWAASLVLGFLVASVAFSVVDFEEPRRQPPKRDGFSFQYPRLFSGGVVDKNGTKDYAAWLISEYYRYYEITLYIPFAIRLALPILALYSLVHVLRAGGPAGTLTSLGAGHVGLGIWVLAAGLAWDYLWFELWLPRVVRPIYETWVSARRDAIAGLEEFTAPAGASQPQAADGAPDGGAPQKAAKTVGAGKPRQGAVAEKAAPATASGAEP